MSYTQFPAKKTLPANNNPGNIIYKPSGFKGGLYQLGNGTLVFDTMENGIAAMIGNLFWYYKSQIGAKKFSIKNILYKWCPPDDKKNPYLRGNDTNIYIKTVTNLTGLGANDVLAWNKANIYKLVRAFCVQEHGTDGVSVADFNAAWEKLGQKDLGATAQEDSSFWWLAAGLLFFI